MSFGLTPEWVNDARKLPAEILAQRPAQSENDDPTLIVRIFGDEAAYELSYGDGTEFVLDATASRLWGSWKAPLALEDFATYLLGPAMGFVLRRRGILTLHASGVAFAGRAVLFCGPAGAGKSTLAAALALGSAPVLCEDIAALRATGGAVQVAPGYPRVCLWPDSVRALSENEVAFPPLTPTWEKRHLPLDGRLATFQDAPLPLAAIYLLDARAESESAPRIEPLRAGEAAPLLVQNTYMNDLLDRQQRVSEFEALGQLLSAVPAFRIVPHADFSRLNALCRLIVAHHQASIRTSAACCSAR